MPKQRKKKEYQVINIHPDIPEEEREKLKKEILEDLYMKLVYRQKANLSQI